MLTQTEYLNKLSLLEDPHDRIAIMNSYAWDIRRSFPAQTLQIAKEVLELAQNLQDKKQVDVVCKFFGSGIMPTNIPVKKGDMIYLFIDGCTDLFGGKDGKKFKTKRLKNLLLEIHAEPIMNQERILNQTFDEWRGNFEQVDDILIMGIRF